MIASNAVYVGCLVHVLWYTCQCSRRSHRHERETHPDIDEYDGEFSPAIKPQIVNIRSEDPIDPPEPVEHSSPHYHRDISWHSPRNQEYRTPSDLPNYATFKKHGEKNAQQHMHNHAAEGPDEGECECTPETRVPITVVIPLIRE